MMDDYERMLAERLEKDGFNDKPKMLRVRYIIYPIIAEIINEYGGILSNEVASMLERHVSDSIPNILKNLKNIDAHVTTDKGNKQRIRYMLIYEALRKFYGNYDHVKSTNSCKAPPLTSMILFSTNKGLEDFIRKHSSMKKIKVVECGF